MAGPLWYGDWYSRLSRGRPGLSPRPCSFRGLVLTTGGLFLDLCCLPGARFWTSSDYWGACFWTSAGFRALVFGPPLALVSQACLFRSTNRVLFGPWRIFSGRAEESMYIDTAIQMCIYTKVIQSLEIRPFVDSKSQKRCQRGPSPLSILKKACLYTIVVPNSSFLSLGLYLLERH